jgi:hypothetical protein
MFGLNMTLTHTGVELLKEPDLLISNREFLSKVFFFQL